MTDGEQKPKAKRRGRKKERTQISLRIDKAVMDIAYQKIKGTVTRITDLVERGLILAVRELGDLTPLFHHARLILHDEGVEFSRLVVNANILRRLPEVRKLSPAEEILRKLALEVIEGASKWPGADEALKLMGAPKDE